MVRIRGAVAGFFAQDVRICASENGEFFSRSCNDVSNAQCGSGAVLGMVKPEERSKAERAYLRWEMIHLLCGPPAIIQFVIPLAGQSFATDRNGRTASNIRERLLGQDRDARHRVSRT